ncbi:MAG TPA: immunoglobulin domain-containing protein, partial [Verrucomicrobiae bacterium]|nr:immunoglobulin domain-containing protein [Verrucomicrobiae bacterium]
MRTQRAAQLVWDPTPQGPGLPVVASYTVYYTATDLPLQKQSVGLNRFFSLDFLPAGKTYTLFVTATSVEGVESDRSGTVPYTPSLGAAPAVVTAPVSKTLVLGEAFSLSVLATGDAPLTYQWFKDGATIAGATSATYSVAASLLTHSGSYTVRISNAAGSAVSTPAVITILAPPTITSQPSSKTANAGTTVTFTVSATGSAPLTYAWFKNGASISGATSATLTLQNVQASANGLYTVVVSNGAGSASSIGATLTVVTPPAITAQPQAITVNVGAAINLSVTASGTAPLSYQWLKGGVNISGATGPTLSIAAANANDAGNYSVRVSNAAGSVTSSSVAVTVVSPPAITTQPVAQTLNAGGTISLSVTATGSLPLAYQWTKDQVNISGATSATFSKTAAQGSDAGSYQVR